MGKIKKKYKMKKNKIIVITLIPVLIILLSIIGYIVYKEQSMNKIKNHFYNDVVTIKKTYLYNKKKEKVAEIKKDFSLSLEKTKINNPNQKYFKLKDLDYYIYYEDITKGEKQEEKTSENEIPFNKNVVSSKKTSLLKEEKEEIVFLKDLDLPLAYETDTSYFVKLQNQLLEIKKADSISTKDVEHTKEKEAEHISVFYYEEIKDECGHINCTTTAHFKEEMNSLKENGYYTISEEEFMKYLNHYIRLKDKAILLITSLSDEQIKPLAEEEKVIIESIDDRGPVYYYSTNQTNTKEQTRTNANRYQIKNFTPLENIIKMAQGEEVKEATDENQKIAVLNYHFFYGDGESCNETICLYTGKFREELDYLKANHYKTLTMNEFKRWMYGEIEMPTNSVLITVDDGAMGTGKHNGNKLIPIIEEYRVNATLFLIAGWWDIENYRSSNLDIQSHTYDMHLYGTCGRGQINCATYDEAKRDLEKSLEIIKNDDSFCFPFYMYSNTSIQAVKDAGFKLAFVGGMKKASRNDNKYLIPRYPIHSSITLNDFIEYVS